jgi:hypothetical protein
MPFIAAPANRCKCKCVSCLPSYRPPWSSRAAWHYPERIPEDPANARIGEAVYVDGPIIKPVAVIEDSRCPKGVDCVWAGRVRIKMLWMRADGPSERSCYQAINRWRLPTA